MVKYKQNGSQRTFKTVDFFVAFQSVLWVGGIVFFSSSFPFPFFFRILLQEKLLIRVGSKHDIYSLFFLILIAMHF